MSAYDAFYQHFYAPVMRELRRDAYGEDVGQHSWVTADDLRADLRHLGLTAECRLLDLGCGPCGPLGFALAHTRCHGTGVDANGSALHAGHAHMQELGLSDRVSLRSADLDAPLPFADASFDAVVSYDVVLHLRDRVALFREVARVLRRDGRFLFTDAGIVTGAIANDEVARRSANGYVQLVPDGWNERALAAAELTLLTSEDRTSAAARNAAGRRGAMERRRAELETMLGRETYESQRDYLAVVEALSRRGALSRRMFLSERAG